MKLRDFALPDTIFVDANIFAYFAVGDSSLQAPCTQFLSRVEGKQIQAVTSTAVLNEAFYAILITTTAAGLNSTKTTYLRKQLGKDKTLSQACYQACQVFSQYVDHLVSCDMVVVAASYELQVAALHAGPAYQLLPTDALHVVTRERYGVAHIATADAHFERVPSLRVWSP
jgi:predicted nucleic acid-binding protein